MPTISRFFGIVVTMNYSEHPPPHFHVRYGEYRALVSIDGLYVLRGQLPPRVFGLVVEWASRHAPELQDNWRRARLHQPLEINRPSGVTMIPVVTNVTARQEHRLHLVFDDGAEGEVDVAEMVPFEGVFAPLRDQAEFRRVRVDKDLGTVTWPGGADLDPLVLYAKVTGRDIEDLIGTRSRGVKS